MINKLAENMRRTNMKRQWDPTIVAALIGSFVIVLGWFVVGYFEDQRSVKNDRRQLRTTYLLEAFRAIEAASHRNHKTEREKQMAMEGALADVQLLGSQEEVGHAVELAKNLEKTSRGDSTVLLEKMRGALRDELHLEKAQKRLLIFRWRSPCVDGGTGTTTCP